MATRSHKPYFMPLLCRPSLNDAVKPSKLSNCDPSSPKLTCIGQIKKKSTTTSATTAAATTSNRFLACSLSTSTSAKSSGNSNLGYTKLHKLFSSKNLISPAIDSTCIINCNKSSNRVTKRSKSCNGRRTVPISKKDYYISSSSRSIDDQDFVRVVVAEELDPPLPVVKCRRSDQDVNVNLWKRRGIEMKSLQIQPIQLTINQNRNNNHGAFSLPTSATTL